MRVKEKDNFLSFLKTIFIDIDCPNEKDVDIAKSEDPKMKELKDSLNRVDALERSFYVSSSSAKGGKSGGIVEKAEVNAEEAMKAVEKKEIQKEQEGREI